MPLTILAVDHFFLRNKEAMEKTLETRSSLLNRRWKDSPSRPRPFLAFAARPESEIFTVHAFFWWAVQGSNLRPPTCKA